MFRGENGSSRLESENKQLKLQLETTLDQARQFQNMMQQWKDKHDALSKKVTTFCSCITSLEYARRQIGGNSNQISKMDIDELLSFAVDEYNKEKKEFQSIAIRFSEKLDEKDKIIEDLKAQISIYEIEKAQPPYIANQPMGGGVEPIDMGMPTPPSDVVLPPLPTPMLEDEDGGISLSVEEDEDFKSVSSPRINAFPPNVEPIGIPLPPIPIPETSKKENKEHKKDKPVSTFSVKKTKGFVGPIIEDDELEMELTPDENSSISALQTSLNTHVFSSTPDFDAPNPKNMVTEDQRKLLKQKLAQANEQKMHMMDINPLINDVRSSEIGMAVFRLIGEQGMSQVPLIKEYLESSSIEKGGKSSINVQINNMIRSKILSRENINTGYRRFIVVDFTPIGLRIFEEIFGKSPVESEKRRLTRENASVEHGYLIQDTMTILKKEFGYVKLTIDRHQNTIKLGDRKTYIPDIVATIDGRNWDYIEVERGTHTQKDFNDKLNKMRMVTKTFYFVSQNQEMLNVVIEKTNKWIEEMGKDSLKGITIKFSTLSHLSKRSWSKIISL